MTLRTRWRWVSEWSSQARKDEIVLSFEGLKDETVWNGHCQEG